MEGSVAKISRHRHSLPRSYGWIRTATGAARRVVILWDTGATHTILNTRLTEELRLNIEAGKGPATLSMADDHTQACGGTVSNLQLLAGPFKQRSDFIIANIGQDDVIVGNDILEPAKGGHGRDREGFWQMTVDGKVLDIPLIGKGQSDDDERVTGVKKMRKLFRDHKSHLRVAMVRKVDSEENTLQDQDAADESGSTPLPTRASIDSQLKGGEYSQRMRRALQQYAEKYEDLQAKMEADRAHFAKESQEVRELLKAEFPTLFQDPEGLPPLRWQNLRIELEDQAQLPRARGLPRLSHTEMEETRAMIDKFVRKGWIEPSMSSYGAPLFFVPKANGKGLRAVADYRQINKITKKILPSLPLMENILTQLQGAKFFSGLDLTSFFYQIRVEPEDVPLTAMRTIYGTYQYKVCPMGMTGSVGVAMHCMESILSHVISYDGEHLPENPRTIAPLPPQPGFSDDEAWMLKRYHSALGSYCCVFIDDILVHSQTKEDHIRHLRQVCATLVQHKLYLNLDKCEIMKPQVTYLGNLIGRYGTLPTRERTQAIRNWPEPQGVSDLRSFLGLCGFVRRWIPEFADVASPLHDLLKKSNPWQWTHREAEAFDELKVRCATPPVLAIPQREDKLVVRTDASREGMGIALYRQDDDGYLQPVEYKSKAFAAAQKKLPAHDRECLAVLYALKSFRHYLLHKNFQVQTDNSALSQIFTSRDLSDLYARWYHKMAEFGGMQIVHRPGRKMWCADALSRRPPTEEELKEPPFEVEAGELAKVQYDSTLDEHARVALIKREGAGFCMKMRCVSGNVGELKVNEVVGQSTVFNNVQPMQLEQYALGWPKLYENDPSFKDMWAQGGDSRWGFYKLNGLLWLEGPAHARLCVPQGADKVGILSQMHDKAGHPGKHRTLARTLGSYYWHGAYGDILRYVKTCDKCQRMKIDRRNPDGAALSQPLPEAPWDTVHMDWVTGLPTAADGSDAILVFIDSLTGMCHFQACKKTDTSKDTARHFVHNVVRLHGVPQAIHSDRDIRLTAHFWKSLQERLGTELRFTTRHHPQANGKVERANATLSEVLRSMCDWAGANWRDHLDMAEFVVNGNSSSVTGMTPFFANTAREPRTPANVGHPMLNVPAADEMADAIFAAVTHCRDALQRAKRAYEKPSGRRPPIYQAGDQVLLSTSTLNLKVRGKLTARYIGPFKVRAPPEGSTSTNVVWLELPRTLKLHLPINVKMVKRYHARPAELGGPPIEPPEPLQVDGVDYWEIEAMVGEQTIKRQKFALIKWAGIDMASATWEPLKNIPPLIIQEYRARMLQAG